MRPSEDFPTRASTATSGCLFFLLFFLGLMRGQPAGAAETNAPVVGAMTLRDVVRRLNEPGPRAALEKETIESARADLRAARAYPNPRVGFNHQDPSGQSTLFNGEHQEQISVELPVLLPGQRASRIARARLDVAAAEARAGAAAMDRTSDTIAAFARLLAAQQKVAILSNSLSEVSGLREKIAGRAAGGAASAYDLARVEVEAGVLSARLASAGADLATEARDLAALLAATNGLPIARGTLAELDSTFRELPDATFSNTPPSVVAATREADAADAGLKVAARNRWPELSIEGGRAWTRHPFGAANFVGLAVEVPLFDRRRGQLDKARSEARAAEARRAVAVAEAESAVRQWAAEIEQREAALDRYRREIEPRLGRLQEMSVDAYLMGKKSILELLDAEQARREVLTEGTETLRSAVEARIRHLAITGRLRPLLAAGTADPHQP